MASGEDVGPVGPYQYSSLPLNHIRLLQLEPSSDPSSLLRCTLSDFDLQSSDIPYDALSYVWGPPVFDHDLYLGDKAQLKITPSLHGALKRLRRDSQPRRIWADAVCINQASDEEKRVQIPLMRSVYPGADTVFVWLGGSDQAASALHRLGLRVRRLAVPDSGLQESEIVLAREIVDEILRLPWFKRRWVIQEVVLNANVLFCAGTAAELNWTKLGTSVTRCYPDAVSRLGYDGTMVHESHSGPQEEVNRADGDRIYALTGLANDVSIRTDNDAPFVPHGQQSQIALRVSYDQSTESAYIKFAEDLISSGRVPWLLE
ncbi:hypothetical protein PG996_008229 [Apiospora saccharicola]|uniref:Heterokaryon incompatibility domain-containing protein n=1 Tax=Apiospora saccharicola TaxID=335842 RepID=A0ABR1UY02_9PEZI